MSLNAGVGDFLNLKSLMRRVGSFHYFILLVRRRDDLMVFTNPL